MDTLSTRLDLKVNYLFKKSFTDLTKAVMRGQADLSICTLGIVWPRYQMGLDATTMVIRNIKIVQLNPLPVDSFYTISYPFSTMVWMSTFVTVAAVFVALILMHRLRVVLRIKYFIVRTMLLDVSCLEHEEEYGQQ